MHSKNLKTCIKYFYSEKQQEISQKEVIQEEPEVVSSPLSALSPKEDLITKNRQKLFEKMQGKSKKTEKT